MTPSCGAVMGKGSKQTAADGMQHSAQPSQHHTVITGASHAVGADIMIMVIVMPTAPLILAAHLLHTADRCCRTLVRVYGAPAKQLVCL